MSRLPAASLASYGLLGLPLAMAALPLYVQVPKFYAGTLGLPLATVGLVLLAARAWDAIQDPLFGLWSDRRRHRTGGRWRFVAWGAPGLAIGMIALFMPPAITGAALVMWLLASLFVVYAGYSLVTVSYQAQGAEIAREPTERTRVTAWREGFALVGVLLAITVPEALAGAFGLEHALAAFALAFAPVLALCTLVTIQRSPPATSSPAARAGSLSVPLRNVRFRRLALLYLVNGTAAAIPATLVLFFIDDVLQAASLAPAALLAYFAAAAVGLPLWVRLSATVGKARAWLAAMALALGAFAWAFALGPGDGAAFLVICGLSGLALGADLALPPSMLADVIDHDERRGIARHEGAYFGLWNLLTKANLAVAAGVSLPLLSALDYVPGHRGAGEIRALACVYALLPSALKALAIALLWRMRNDERNVTP
jgi:GPH family glycoside/pentoside/hexuronide:cation symporter